MPVLTRYRSFEDLKSGENLLSKKSLDSKKIAEEFIDFISFLQGSVRTMNQSNNGIDANEQ